MPGVRGNARMIDRERCDATGALRAVGPSGIRCQREPQPAAFSAAPVFMH